LVKISHLSPKERAEMLKGIEASRGFLRDWMLQPQNSGWTNWKLNCKKLPDYFFYFSFYY
jgi:hypothetical protein